MFRGNSVLVEYGVQNEASDIRAHVGVLAGKVYVYSTKRGLSVMNAGVERGAYTLRPAYTTTPDGHRLTTAMGCPVPVADLQPYEIDAAALIERVGFSECDSTSTKGAKAIQVVAALLRSGSFPLPVNGEIVEDVDMQRQGLDIVVSGRWRIQVKCDYRGGRGHPDCTGRLYLQTHECNPFGHN